MARDSKTAKQRKPNANPKAPALIAYHVTERGKDKSFWTRIGAAWDHEDGKGLTLQLDLVPVNGGRMVLRVPGENTDEQGEGRVSALSTYPQLNAPSGRFSF